MPAQKAPVAQGSIPAKREASPPSAVSAVRHRASERRGGFPIVDRSGYGPPFRDRRRGLVRDFDAISPLFFGAVQGIVGGLQ